MKKLKIILFLALLGSGAIGLILSCSPSTPTAAQNFQNPVSTIVGINPTFTPTPSLTPTSSPTVTPTGTPTGTPTPFVTATPWTGFNAPAALAVDGSSNVYVADTGNNKVGKYNSNGFLVTGWGYGGVKGKIPYTNPVGVAVNSGATSLLVVGSGNQVSLYNSTGNLVTATFSGVSLSNPQGVALDGSGNVYVADTGNNRIVQLTGAGAAGSGLAGGSGILNLTAPVTYSGVTITSPVTLSGIAVDSTGTTICIATQGTGINGSSYSMVLGFTTSGSAAVSINGFTNPTGIVFDSNGNLYVADTGNKQVEEFASGSFNQIPLAFNASGMTNPKGIGVDSNFNIYVTDAGANDVVKFAP